MSEFDITPYVKETEIYAGEVLKEMNAYYKRETWGVSVHYEGVFQNRDYEDTISDVESDVCTAGTRSGISEKMSRKNRLSCVNICMIWETH